LGPDGRTARFLFRGEPGELVTVCGDFDNWDPFIHELAETSPGTYELALPLPPGIHHYAFVYRGEYLPDPLNPEKALSGDGRLVSVLVSGG
ncbi:MAG TPA: glycogen-binding domain-containing protein, partial [Spirochaetales bacterium]|nr:glycogen-binding domain-containing protein [Spirochaetales bacterium]